MASNTQLQDRLAALTPERRAALEKLLAGKAGASRQQTRIPLRPPGTEAPLSAAEQRLRFLAYLEPDSPWYNVYSAVEIEGELQESLLRESRQRVVDRHEILRTTYRSEGGILARSIAPRSSAHLTVVDLSGEPDAQKEQALERLMNQETRTVFDLEKGPLLRSLLVRLAPRRHILLTTAHHIISDGLSMRILGSESLAIAAAMAAKLPEILPDLPVQYADFARFEQKNAAWEQHLPYWKQQLAGSPQLLDLPTDRPRPAIQTHQGRRHYIQVDSQRLEGLRTLSREHGATLFMTVLAAFGVLLHRYSGASDGTSDIMVGSPVAGRTHPDVENLIGCFVNTLALRLDLSGDATFLDLLARVRRTTQDALEHQDLPFEKLVEELQPARSRSYAPVFQAMFNLQREWDEKVRGLEFRTIPVYNGTTLFDVTLSLMESGSALSGHLEYNADLFDEATIARMAGHFDTLLSSILEDPARPLSALPMLSAGERRLILDDWNNTAREWPSKLIPAMFEEQAERTPANVAVVHDGVETTYRELNQRANQIAHLLQSLQIGPGSLVGVQIEKSPELVPALLGVLKAGAAYVPLDPEYPAARLQLVLEDARLALVLGDREAIDSQIDARINAQSTENPACRVGAEDPAYVMYTSGSTGTPKGVVVPHRALANYIRWMDEAFPLTPADRVVQRTSVSFDLSVWELFAPLAAGARLILPVPADARDPQRLAGLVREQQATVIQFVPSLLREILAGQSFDSCTSLRRIFSGGEILPPELVRDLAARLDAEIVNKYGPTETCINSTSYRCPPDSEGIVPIGRPIANTQAYVLDSHLEPVPPGVRGELYLGGHGLALGYLNRPALTEERFLPHPFSSTPGERVYRTGDWARFRPDGNLEVLGRLDRQVKIRGYRIELEDVEAALRRSSDVASVAVVLRAERPEDPQLVAYVVPSTPAPLRIEALRAHLRQQVPEYMMPSQFVRLDALPLAPNGKVNRAALPAVDGRRPDSATYVPPADALEARLARLWERVLDVQPMGRQDHFFELGGHSLAALRMFAEIEKDFGSSIPVAALYEAPVLEQLATILRADHWSPRWSSMIPLQASGRHTPFFCVHADTGHIFFYQDLAFRLGKDQPVYAFESQGLDGKATPLATVEEMAAHYIREMRDVQPRGPYLLGGFCFGAYIALEMAHQLQAQGEAVPVLVSFNTDGAWRTVQSLRDSIRLHRRQIYEWNRTRVFGYFLERILYRMYRWSGVYARAKARWNRARQRPVPAAVRGTEIRELNFAASTNYVPRKYDGTLLYFQGSGDASKPPELFWENLVARIETHVIPGQGLEILREPGVQVLARQLEQCLEKLGGRPV